MIPVREKSAENVVQVYLSGTLAHKGGNVVRLSDNSTEFENKVLNEVCNQLGIKRLFCNLFQSQRNAREGNVNNFLKWTLSKFLESSDLERDELLPLDVIVTTHFSAAMAWSLHSS